MTESANVTIRLERDYKEFLERVAKSRFISVGSLFKQGSLLWLEEHGIDYSQYVETDFSKEKKRK